MNYSVEKNARSCCFQIEKIRYEKEEEEMACPGSVIIPQSAQNGRNRLLSSASPSEFRPNLHTTMTQRCGREEERHARKRGQETIDMAVASRRLYYQRNFLRSPICD